MESPLTGSTNVRQISRRSPDEIALRWRSELGIDISEEFRDLDELLLWRCEDTKLEWWTPATAAGSSYLYERLEERSWYYLPDKWEFKRASALVGQSEVVLEVGAGKGDFLRHCQRQGLKAVGTELNAVAARGAVESGLNVVNLSLKELADQRGPESFDVVCAFQVLEHIPNPGQFLHDALVNLKVGGRLIFSVPNSAVMRSVDPMHRDLLNQPPHHMAHYDLEVFRRVSNHYPVTLQSSFFEPLAKYHTQWFLRSYLQKWLRFLPKPLLRPLLNRFTLYPLVAFLNFSKLRKVFRGHTILVVFEKIEEG